MPNALQTSKSDNTKGTNVRTAHIVVSYIYVDCCRPLFLNPNLFSSLGVRNHVPHPYKTTKEIQIDSKGYDDGVSHSELLDFWTLSIIRYSTRRNYNTRRFGNWICFRPRVWGEDIYSVRSLRQS
jgi:hypothetical protein